MWITLVALDGPGLGRSRTPDAPGEARRHTSDEIVVTSERSSRPLRDTPSSAVVVTAKDLDFRASPDRIEQILEAIPNVQISSGGEGPTIRGQDTTGPTRDLAAFLGGTRPRGSGTDRDDRGLLRFKLLVTPAALPRARAELTYVHSQSLMPQVEGVRPPFRKRRDPVGG